MIADQQDIYALFDELYLLDEPEISEAKESEKKPNPLSFKGGNKKRILFIHHDKDQLSEKDQEMLHSLIVNAIKISWDDVAVINLFENGTPLFETLNEQLQPQKVLVWGCDGYLPHGEKYAVTDHGSYQLLSADPIQAYHDNRDLKVALWSGIRELLGI